jgi:hypothetical protein
MDAMINAMTAPDEKKTFTRLLNCDITMIGGSENNTVILLPALSKGNSQ